MPFLVTLILVALVLFGFSKLWKTKEPISTKKRAEIEKYLKQDIEFYKKINTQVQKNNFQQRVIHFIETVRFTDVGTAKHTLLDEVLIATSAIIPIFSFPNWQYNNISEILLYEDYFNTTFDVNENHHIMGMVGEGAMNNTMALSLRALRDGFEESDGHQTAIHEFIHLIDKADGATDGVPEYLIPKKLIEPWLRLIRSTILEIKQGDTTINSYASTNEEEFFAVISEYFFENPTMLQHKHPELFNFLNQIFEPKTNK